MKRQPQNTDQQNNPDNPRWLLIALGSIGTHQLQSFIAEPEERVSRIIIMSIMVFLWFSRLFLPERTRGILWMVLSLPPLLGAFGAHLIPIARNGRVPLASETAPFNLGGSALLFALGVALARKSSSKRD